ncbi:protein of unknown function [Cardinium endosymbiont cEper1 of Encarsia pergandiella]|nr:protein of unknown function [Cardinium endosymbiont cEper1 of Encarsia pergandiella]
MSGVPMLMRAMLLLGNLNRHIGSMYTMCMCIKKGLVHIHIIFTKLPIDISYQRASQLG